MRFRLNTFLVTLLIPLSMFAQSRPETALRFSKDFLLQMEIGFGTGFYKMDSENEFLAEVDKQVSLSNDELSGGTGFSIGGGIFLPSTGIRLRLNYRTDEYTNKYDNFLSSFFSTILFIDATREKFDLTHSIGITTLHLEKMISTDPNYQGLLLGVGGFYGWISDERKEVLTIQKNNENVRIRHKLNIDAEIAGINLVIGKYYENGWAWVEFRPGYQFQIQSTIPDSGDPGKNPKGLNPKFSTFTLQLALGFSL